MKIIKGIISKNRTILVYIVTAFILTILMTSIGGCSAMKKEDIIKNLSFSHDGKKVVFDRCKDEGCQIQVYDLATGELAAYQSPKNERWSMGRYSYDGRRITFSVIPLKENGERDLEKMQIAVMDADGKNFKKVTTGPGAKIYPVFSHNGKKILYACGAYIRKSGKTPAADYDAWEVNIETGEQTRLTYFEYFYMDYLTYFPDDERFIYYGERPDVYEGLQSYPDEKTFGRKMDELFEKGTGIIGVVVMKGRERIPNPYHFPRQTRAETPLLSRDGSMMIYQKALSAGKFYLYSEDGNHRLVSHSGSVRSVAISPDGELFGSNFDDSIFVKRISDGTSLRAVFVRRSEEWDESVRKMPYIRLLPKSPSRIINN